MNTTVSQLSFFTDAILSLGAATIHKPFSYHGIATVKTPQNVYLTYRTHTMDAAIIVENCYLKVYDRFLDSVNNEGHIIDIGGHIGVPSITLARQFPQTKILTFEPHPETYHLLKTNIAQNDLPSHIIPIQKAVSSKKGSIRLYLDTANTGGNSILQTQRSQSLDVQTMTLQDIFTLYAIKRCSLLHIDAEGAEYEIVKTAPKDIFKKIQVIICEYQTKEIGNALQSLLYAFGFDITITDGIPIFPLNKLIHIPLLVAKKHT